MKNIENLLQRKCLTLTYFMHNNKIYNLNAFVVTNICNLTRDALKHANVVDLKNL